MSTMEKTISDNDFFNKNSALVLIIEFLLSWHNFFIAYGTHEREQCYEEKTYC